MDGDEDGGLSHGAGIGLGLAAGGLGIFLGEYFFGGELAGSLLSAGFLATAVTAWIRRDLIGRWWFLLCMAAIVLAHVVVANALMQTEDITSQAFRGLAWIDVFLVYGLVWLVEKAVNRVGRSGHP